MHKYHLLKTNLQLFFKHRFLLIFTILLPIVFNLFFGIIFTSYDIDQVPIGLIDQDQSSISKDIVQGLKDHPSLSVETSTLAEAEKMLKTNKIEAYFIILKGFNTAIESSDYKESIELYYLDKSSIGPALGDLIAGEVMMPLAIHKAANMSDYYAKKNNLQAHHDKTLALGKAYKDENTFVMNIDTIVKMPQVLANETLDIQEVLKLNMIAGFSLIVMSFAILFSNSYLIDSHYKRVENRLIVSGIKYSQLYYMKYLSVLLNTVFIVIIEVITLSLMLPIHTAQQLLSLMCALFLYGLFLTTLITFLSNIIKSKRIYQSILAPLLFIIGLLGGAFWSTEFLSEDLQFITQLSPIHYPLRVISRSILNSEIYSFLDGYLGYIGFIVILNATALMLFTLKNKRL